MPEKITIRDTDRDSLSILPLSIIPLETKALQEFRLVKNNHLEGVVEMFDDHHAGKGHIHPKNLHNEFSAISGEDTALIEILAKLHSYDVYSLRIRLREMGIKVNDSEHLKLSNSIQQELSVYLQPFIKRLILQIYGDAGEMDETADLTALFKDPDVKVARQKLETISGNLNIQLQEVPIFLEEYGDIYLSISYYRQCLDLIDPAVGNFLYCSNKIKENTQLRQNVELFKVCNRLQRKVEKLRDVLSERFAVFEKTTEMMWRDMSAERFSEFKKLVEDNHAALGGLLCTLSVKMNDWDKKFPNTFSAGPARWADYMMMDIRQGF